MMFAQGAEQIPVPCGRCGAPMIEQVPAALVGPDQVACTFCRATEVVPAARVSLRLAVNRRLF